MKQQCVWYSLLWLLLVIVETFGVFAHWLACIGNATRLLRLSVLVLLADGRFEL
jgi:hypothetical protein